MTRPHLREVELSLYIDGKLGPSEHRRVREHLDTCDACRAEELEVRELLAAAPRHSVPPTPRVRRRIWVAGASLVAAGLAAVLLVRPAMEPAPTDAQRTQLRNDGMPAIVVYHPSEDAALERGDLQFAWAAHPAETYRISVTAADGGLLWSETLADTMATPPASLELTPGARYYWYVDAIGTGIVGRSRVHTFRLAP